MRIKTRSRTLVEDSERSDGRSKTTDCDLGEW